MNNGKVHTKDNGLTDSYGYLCFGISGSDGSESKTQLEDLPFYNDDMWSVLLTDLVQVEKDYPMMVSPKKLNMN